MLPYGSGEHFHRHSIMAVKDKAWSEYRCLVKSLLKISILPYGNGTHFHRHSIMAVKGKAWSGHRCIVKSLLIPYRSKHCTSVGTQQGLAEALH